MTQKQPVNVALSGEAALSQYGRLFRGLGAALGIHFCAAADLGGAPAAVVHFGDMEGGCRGTWPESTPLFHADQNKAEPFGKEPFTVQFSPEDEVPGSLRGQTLREDEPKPYAPVALSAGDRVLASVRGQAIWAARQTGGQEAYCAGILPPALEDGEHLYRYYQAGRFIRLLPLLAFLRQVRRRAGWEYPHRMACLVIDDPSLYWPSYGYVNFRKLAEHAREHDYCAAIAIVPLDTWMVHPGAAGVFREYTDRLSLMPHGNNHVQKELGHAPSEEEALKHIAQALRRFARLERVGGLELNRVMEPPHGAINLKMLRAMGRLGFEGVLYSPELMKIYTPDHAWEPELGFGSADLIGEAGLTGIRRIRMAPRWDEEVRLAGALDQPLALASHHSNAADGMRTLEEFAAIVRSFGGTRFGSPKQMARSHYHTRLEGEVFHLRLNTRHAITPIPPGVKQVSIDRPWLDAPGGPATEGLTLRAGGQVVASGQFGASIGPFEVRAGDSLEAASHLADRVEAVTVSAPKLRLWPVARKVLMEVRDRANPIFGVKTEYVKIPDGLRKEGRT